MTPIDGAGELTGITKEKLGFISKVNEEKRSQRIVSECDYAIGRYRDKADKRYNPVEGPKIFDFFQLPMPLMYEMTFDGQRHIFPVVIASSASNDKKRSGEFIVLPDGALHSLEYTEDNGGRVLRLSTISETDQEGRKYPLFEGAEKINMIDLIPDELGIQSGHLEVAGHTLDIRRIQLNPGSTNIDVLANATHILSSQLPTPEK
jgi:hypothetical protein